MTVCLLHDLRPGARAFRLVSRGLLPQERHIHSFFTLLATIIMMCQLNAHTTATQSVCLIPGAPLTQQRRVASRLKGAMEIREKVHSRRRQVAEVTVVAAFAKGDLVRLIVSVRICCLIIYFLVIAR